MRRMYSEGQLKDVIKEEVEGGQLENAKPIYWHSCSLQRIDNGSLVYHYDFIIINNDATPFTKDTFFAWLNEHKTAEIKIVQGYNTSVGSNGFMSYFKYQTDASIASYAVIYATGEIQGQTQGWSNATFTDNGVNKIN